VFAPNEPHEAREEAWPIRRAIAVLVAASLELVAIVSVALVVNAITRDGEATWFEGVLLLGVYVLLAFAFFFATPPAS